MSEIKLAAIHTYPIKSCAALSHREIELDARGPAWDRRFMVIGAGGAFLTQRQRPALALVRPALAAGMLRLAAPGMSELRVPLERTRGPIVRVEVWGDPCEAWDEGEDAAQWFSDHLRTAARLVRMADGFERPVHAPDGRRLGETGFADASPLLVVSQASLAELNRRLAERGHAPVPMSRFRPNLVVEGCAAFAEDTWHTIRVGSVTLDLVKPCVRCVVTTVDQATARSPEPTEPLATLAEFRRKGNGVVFAWNAQHRAPGRVAVGDRVEVLASA